MGAAPRARQPSCCLLLGLQSESAEIDVLVPRDALAAGRRGGHHRWNRSMAARRIAPGPEAEAEAAACIDSSRLPRRRNLQGRLLRRLRHDGQSGRGSTLAGGAGIRLVSTTGIEMG